MSTTQQQTHSQHHKRFKALLALVIAGVFVFFAAQPVVASDPATTIATQVNVDRAEQGLPALVRNAALDEVAADWAAHMAETGVMEHNPNLADQVPAGWTIAGENVAQGQADGETMEAAWMDSEHHRDNILGDFTDIGIAFVTADGTTWGVQVFAKY